MVSDDLEELAQVLLMDHEPGRPATVTTRDRRAGGLRPGRRPDAWVQQRGWMSLLAVNYHYVRRSFDAPYPAIFGSTVAEFEAQLGLLAKAGRFVSPQEVLAAVAEGGMPGRSILVTFDDGLREQVECAWEVLCKLGIPALFFVNSAPILTGRVETVHKVHQIRSVMPPEGFLELVGRIGREGDIEAMRAVASERAREQYPYDDEETARVKYLLNCVLSVEARESLVDRCFEMVFPGQEAEIGRRLYLSIDQVRSLGDAIGSHSHRHLPLGLVSRSAAARDLVTSANQLRDWLGRAPVAVSYPYGSRETCPAWLDGAASQAGFRFGFTMERALNETFTHPLRLARMDSSDLPGGRHCRLSPGDLFTAIPMASWSART